MLLVVHYVTLLSSQRRSAVPALRDVVGKGPTRHTCNSGIFGEALCRRGIRFPAFLQGTAVIGSLRVVGLYLRHTCIYLAFLDTGRHRGVRDRTAQRGFPPHRPAFSLAIRGQRGSCSRQESLAPNTRRLFTLLRHPPLTLCVTHHPPLACEEALRAEEALRRGSR